MTISDARPCAVVGRQHHDAASFRQHHPRVGPQRLVTREPCRHRAGKTVLQPGRKGLLPRWRGDRSNPTASKPERLGLFPNRVGDLGRMGKAIWSRCRRQLCISFGRSLRKLIWTLACHSLFSRPCLVNQPRLSAGEFLMVPSSTPHHSSPWPVFAAAILAVMASGCQTPQTNPYATTVAPPATGMAGQPAPYGYNAAVPQGSGYPSSAPMPGPAMQPPAAGQMPPPGQIPPAASTATMPPAASTATMQPPALPPGSQPQGSSWSWAQTSNTPPPPTSLQQAGAPPPQSFTAQAQQQANQYQQQLAGQAQQYSNQAQQATNNTINGYQNQLNNQWQQANQQVQNGIQQAVPPAGQPVPQQAQYPPQSSTSSWWPFGDPNQFPPARATPAPPPSY